MTRERVLSIWIVGLLVLGPLVFLIPEGEGLDLRMDRDLGFANASFWGEDAGDEAGCSVACAGDVNGDGYDDLLIGAYLDEEGGVDAGQTYLILGKATGWAMDTALSAASASFWGENTNDYAGFSVAGAGDVNGDGYDDILIGAYGDATGGSAAGQTYLILGKASGWAMDTDLSASSASFWGEDAGDYSGGTVAGAGDVNGDGYDDFIIGANGDDDGGLTAGQTYLILGKASGWAMDTDLSAASASFWGENAFDNSGFSVAGVGDVNGDLYDDFLIGAWANDDGGSNAGQSYLIFGKASGWAMDTDLSASNASFWGEDADDYAGYSVAGAGDVNGDGYDDILIGAFNDEETGATAGQTYMILGKASGWAMDADLSASSASFRGEEAGDNSGYSVAGAGDVNSDGYDDFIIGAYQNDAGGSAAGQAYLMLGKPSGWVMHTDLSLASASFIGEVTIDNAGGSVACAGDVNGDGYDDILIGAIGNDDGGSAAGQTYLVMPFFEPPAPRGLNARVSGSGSMIISWARPERGAPNSYEVYRSTDGIRYVLLNYIPPASTARMSYTDADVVEGGTYFYSVVATYSSGEASSLNHAVQIKCEPFFGGLDPGFGEDWKLRDSHASFLGESASDYSGLSVAGAGDVNGDGRDDIIIGAYGNDETGSIAGQAYVVFGNASGWAIDTSLSAASASFRGENAGDYVGFSVAGAGDVNGDGYDDILIGARNNDDGGSDAGQVYLVLGKPSGWAMDTGLSTASASFWGEDASDYAGICVAGAGDVNGDGYDDIIIGAQGDDDGGASAGQTYLIFGRASGWAMDTDLSAANASFWGEETGDWSAYCVAGAGDVNGDGFDDFLIGAQSSDEAGSAAGQAYLILGRASGWAMDTDLSAVNASFWGENAADVAGYTVAGAGDVNRDGYDDILVGAYANDDGGFNAGQAYLVLGKASGWAMDTSLSASSASFWGEMESDDASLGMAGAGDLNNDGYDDILIGAYTNDDGGSGAGQTYLVFGRASGWAMDTGLSTAPVSFWGEKGSDFAGFSVDGAGDVNGDGFCDILIGAYGNDESGSLAGQTYLMMPFCKPPAPRNLNAQLSQASNVINLTWDPVGYWREGIAGYRVLVSTDGTNFKEAAFRLPSNRAFSDANVSFGRTYYYIVLTEDGNGAFSGRTSMVSLVCDRDTDNDGIGNMADWDDDGDGVPDGQDAFPLNPAETMDTDWDGTGNNADTDDDNDGIPDASDPEPLNPQNELRYHLIYLNSTLQAVQGQITGMQALLASMNGNLTSLTTNVNNMNTGLTNLGNTIRADINNLGAGVAVNMSGMNATLRADIVALQGWLSGMNGTLRSDMASIQAGLSGMNATLRGDISTVVSGMAGMNATLQNDIATVIGNMAGMNSTLRNDIVTVIGNMAGMNSTLRNDIVSVIGNIAGLNSTLQNNVTSILNNISKINSSLDITQVMNSISGMNFSLQNNISTVLGSMAGMNTSLKTDIGTVVTAMAGMNSTLRGDIASVLSGMTSMNASLRGNISSVLTAVSGMNSTFRTDLLGMNASLAAAIAGVGTDVDSLASVVAGISSDLSDIQAYLAGMNASTASGMSGLGTKMDKDIAALETRLDADIAALGIALEAVNASIQLELDGLGDDMAEFRDEVAQGIAAILAKLDQNNQTQNENYGKLQALLNSINTTSLVEIKNQLTALKTDSDAMEAGLIAKLDDFRNRTMTKLDNLTGLMAILDDIKSLTSEVQNLKTNVDDVKDSQAGTKKTVETLAPTTWMSVVLILIVLVVAIALLLMSRGKKGNIPVPERTAGATMPARNVKQEPLPGGEGMKP